MSYANTAEQRNQDYHDQLLKEHRDKLAGLKTAITAELNSYFEKYKEFFVPGPFEKNGMNDVAGFVHSRPNLERIVNNIGSANLKMTELYSIFMEALASVKNEVEMKTKKNE